jgi:hypothetical protein
LVSKLETDYLMSSLAAETVMHLKQEINPPSTPSLVAKAFDKEDPDLKIPNYGFDDSYATKAGPSSAGLEEQGYFDNLPVLEKGSGGETATMLTLPFVLDETYVRPQAEGGWAGWTCVAGSWLVCSSSPLIDLVS